MTTGYWINGVGVLAVVWVLARAVMAWRSGEGNRIGDYLLQSGPQHIRVERSLSASKPLIVIGLVLLGGGLSLSLVLPVAGIVGLVSMVMGTMFLTFPSMGSWPEVAIGHNAVILMTARPITLRVVEGSVLVEVPGIGTWRGSNLEAVCSWVLVDAASMPSAPPELRHLSGFTESSIDLELPRTAREPPFRVQLARGLTPNDAAHLQWKLLETLGSAIALRQEKVTGRFLTVIPSTTKDPEHPPNYGSGALAGIVVMTVSVGGIGVASVLYEVIHELPAGLYFIPFALTELVGTLVTKRLAVDQFALARKLRSFVSV